MRAVFYILALLTLVACTNDFLSGLDRAPEGEPVAVTEAGVENNEASGGVTRDSAADGGTTDATTPDATILDGGGDGGDATDAEEALVADGATTADEASVCERGICPPVALVSYAYTVQGLAVDANNIYFTDSVEGVIWKCGLEGCNDEPTALSVVGAPPYPQSIAVGNGYIYWLDYDPSQGYLLSCSVDGYDNPASALAGSLAGPFSIALDSNSVYWTDQGAGNVMELQLSPSGTETALASGRTLVSNNLGGLALDDTNVYWADSQGIMACAKAGCNNQPTPVVVDAQADWLIVGGANVYWADQSAGTIYECSLPCGTVDSGAGPTVLGAQIGQAQGMVVDDTNLYWVNAAIGTVMRCPIAGCDGGPTLMADLGPESRVSHMAIDATHIYFSTYPATTGVGAVYSQLK